ncbi:hypothetical protein G7Y89_g12981 [Cudoniella acicularis]|uniref:Cep57 centrosome microtubule-binding domain-containing protein n=1 Tax=Cudoniella acicularis TaxID=354080 RepID=A0A8H4R9D8_9HELO|nr:hypothetical protein G7Y89_g12981 [Cudoniella acicularis]
MPFNNSFSAASSTGSNHGTVSLDSTLTLTEEIFQSTDIMSYEELSQKLPELRDTAKKFNRWQPRRPQQELVINTSALAKAFPNFSDGGDTDTFSVEVGRAPTRQKQQTKPRVEAFGPIRSPIVTVNGYKLTDGYSPTSILQDAAINGAQKAPSAHSKVSRYTAKAYPRNAPLNNDDNHHDELNEYDIPSNHITTSHIIKNKENLPHSAQKAVSYDIRNNHITTSHINKEQKERFPPSAQKAAISAPYASYDIRSNHIDEEHEKNLPPSAQKSVNDAPYVSYASRTTSGERKSRAELQPHVADDSDGSFLGADRPPTITLQPKNTRFSNGQARSQQRAPISSNVSSKRQPFEEETPCRPQQLKTQHRPQKSAQSNNREQTTTSTTPNPTQFSFFIPPAGAQFGSDSTTYTNSAPVFTHDNNVPQVKDKKAIFHKAEFGPVDEIVVPDEEEDIYELIEILKSRVSRVEAENSDYKNNVKDLTQDNQQLELEKKALEEQINDALRLTAEGNGGNMEQPAMKPVEFRRVSQHQGEKLKESTAAKDELKKQLEEAYSYVDKLQADIQNFKSDVEQHDDLQQEIDTLETKKREITSSWKEQESTLRARIHRQGNAIAAMRNIANRMYDATRDLVPSTAMGQEKSPSFHSIKKNKHRSEKASVRQESKSPDIARKAAEQAQKLMNEMNEIHDNLHFTNDESRRGTEAVDDAKVANYPAIQRPQSRRFKEFEHKMNTNRHIIENQQNYESALEHDLSLDDDTTNGTVIHNDVGRKPSDGTQASSNFSSMLGTGFLPTMRNHADALEGMKSQQSTQLVAFKPTVHRDIVQDEIIQDDTVQSNTVHTIQSIQSSRASPHGKDDKLKQVQTPEPSFQDDTVQTVRTVQTIQSSHPSVQDDTVQTVRTVQSGRSSRRSVKDDTAQTVQSTRSSRPSAKENTVRTVQSVRSSRAASVQTITRHEIEADDMTSAFIIPDIEIGNRKNGKERPSLSTQAREILHEVCLHNHNSDNCTICYRILSAGDKASSRNTGHAPYVRKPIPVSDRMPEPEPYEDEPTFRPATDPGLALATVIQSLKDEITHLKMKNTEIQEAYDKFDVSLGRRQRKVMEKSMEELRRTIGLKSDQLYDLYDVLEGQKMAGQEMRSEDGDVFNGFD